MMMMMRMTTMMMSMMMTTIVTPGQMGCVTRPLCLLRVSMLNELLRVPTAHINRFSEKGASVGAGELTWFSFCGWTVLRRFI